MRVTAEVADPVGGKGPARGSPGARSSPMEGSNTSLRTRKKPSRNAIQCAVETHLFRICQEAITNIARHSGATRAVVRLYEGGDRVVLLVEDVARGMPTGALAVHASVGLGPRGAHAPRVLDPAPSPDPLVDHLTAAAAGAIAALNGTNG